MQLLPAIETAVTLALVDAQRNEAMTKDEAGMFAVNEKGEEGLATMDPLFAPPT